MDTLETYNRQSDPVPSRRGIMRDLVGSLMVSAVILAFLACVNGCGAIAPKIVTTEVIKTDKGFTIRSPKDVDASFFQAGPIIYARYKSTGNESAIKAGSEEAAKRAEAVGKLAEAAASLK